MPRLRRRELSAREVDPVVHSGVIFKRGYGRLLGRKTWKPRHFVLTRTKLRYYTFENGKLRDEVDLRRCSEKSFEVMPADIRTRGRSVEASIWRLALNVPQGRRLVMAAPTEFEMNAWAKQIRTVLRELARKKNPELERGEPKAKPTPPLQQEKNVDETKEEEEVFNPPVSNQSDVPILDDEAVGRPATATWKTTTTDFQNFVAQPRRSMIFRRQSFEGQPLVPGVYRHSTGQLDDRELQKELEELRAAIGIVPGATAAAAASMVPDDQDDEMDEEEEEALLQALRQFSKVHRESGRPEMESKSELPCEAVADDAVDTSETEKDCAEPEVVISPVKPIFYYKREEALVQSSDDSASNSAVVGTEVHDISEDKWFSRISGKFSRHAKRPKTDSSPQDASSPSISGASTSQRTSLEDDDNDLPAHFHEDPATSKRRRYSTGSMLLTSERSALAPERDSETEREDALIHELLTGLVYCDTDEASTSPRGFASPRDDLEAPALDHAKKSSRNDTVLSVSSVDVDELRRVGSFDVDEMRRAASSVDIDATSCLEANTTTASSVISSARPSLDSHTVGVTSPRASQEQNLVNAAAPQPELDDFPTEDTWFSSFKTKWRASRDEKKERKRAAKRAKSLPVPPTPEPVEEKASDSFAQPADGGADCDAVSVVSDLVTSAAALDYPTWTPRASEMDVTSPCSVTARGMQPRQLYRNSSVPAPSADSVREAPTRKRSVFGRWRDKRRNKQETRSHRQSLGDMITESAIPSSEPATSTAEGVESPQAVGQADTYEPESHHFSARYRRDLSKPRGLIELQNTTGVGSARSHTSGPFGEEEDDEEEVVVVVVRRRHSMGCAEDEGPPSSRRSQKRVKYRVYVDVDEEDDAAKSNLSKQDASSTMPDNLHQLISTPMQSTRICAA